MIPETKYAESPNGAIGYQVFGDGPVDLVFITQWLTNVDGYWEEPSAARYFDRLASFARVIIFDKLGTGVSDPMSADEFPTIEGWVQDVVAVMEAANSEKAVIVGDVEGGTMAIRFATMYPERTHCMVLINALAKALRTPDYPVGMPERAAERSAEIFIEQHGTTGAVLDYTAPSVANDQRFRRWWVKFQRSTMPPKTLREGYRWQQIVDVTDIVSDVSVPTLVIHRKDNYYHRIDFGRWIAEQIPGAEFVELEGGDSLPFHVGDFHEILDHVEDFVTGSRLAVKVQRQLATVLFTDIVGSTDHAVRLGDEKWLDLMADIDKASGLQVKRFGGRPIRSTGDGHVALFDTPAPAIQAARAVIDECQALGVDMRAGVHAGEITVEGDEIGGIGVHIASRVMDRAPDGGLAVSRTVKDLTVGSAIEYRELGEFELKGVPGEWALFEVS